MNFQTITTEIRHTGIGVITLNRPEKRNAISIEMRREISACLKGWQESEAVGAIIFTGSGEVFTAGFDLSEFTQPALYADIYETSARYHRDIWYFPKPTIAAVNGPALAGGFDLAKLCDLRICSKTAVFGHPEIKFGVPPLLTPLRWIVGEGMARDLCMTGRRIDATEAYRAGLVSEVVDGDKLMERACRLALTILEAPMSALHFIKTYMLDHANRGFEEAFSIEHDRAFHEFLLRKKNESGDKQ
ncbi:MAG: enoyl-CoA hydratase/isomerase family protein [Syntrophaceae bacterium]|jgi:enoyl-CoA hydratase|nr:enoyl-CoA hydratase/isomerase family protein [Syntrophaceae bacterium]